MTGHCLDHGAVVPVERMQMRQMRDWSTVDRHLAARPAMVQVLPPCRPACRPYSCDQ